MMNSGHKEVFEGPRRLAPTEVGQKGGVALAADTQTGRVAKAPARSCWSGVAARAAQLSPFIQSRMIDLKLMASVSFALGP